MAIKSNQDAYDFAPVPLTNMSFTPDVAPSALGPSEYNAGLNVETDVRGIKKVNGEVDLLNSFSDPMIYVDGGFRTEGNFWYIVATLGDSGAKWFAMNTSGGITDITPGGGYLSGYTTDTPITGSWIGNTFIVNDTLRAPMYLKSTNTSLQLYDSAPDNYIWNYESSVGVNAVRAGFVRNYSSPNVGNILVAGNLTKDYSNGTTVKYPVTFRWSQAFGLNEVPTSWNPTLNNVANETEAPLRGGIIDGLFFGGKFYLFSEFDVAIMNPINYVSTSAPTFSISLFNQGRGLLSNGSWTATDQVVFGVDSRDFWTFQGSEFQSIGNQRVRNFFFKDLNRNFPQRVFLINNTYKHQIECYYPDTTSTQGFCNKMLSYRYDLDIWNAPKTVQNAIYATEAPVGTLSSRYIVYAKGGSANSKLVQTNVGTGFSGNPINCYIERNQIKLPGQAYNELVTTHRLYPEVTGSGSINISLGGSQSTGGPVVYSTQSPFVISSTKPWVQPQSQSYRTTSFKISSNDATNTWSVNTLNFQTKTVEVSL